MDGSISRRAVIAGAVLAVPAFMPFKARAATADIAARLAELEARNGGRLGVAVLDVATGRLVGNRVDERFAMCSTFKALAAAFVLVRVDRGQERLDRRIAVTRANLLPYSPVTERRVGAGGMTVAELCAAAVTRSDNAAANLLLASFGGPAGLTTWLRSIGDEVTRLDRMEPELNEATPGDPRDTTTPAAMAATLRRLVLGDALAAASREQLTAWLVDTRTGDDRLRAGLPKGWRIGDKTGTGRNGTTNDIAVIWPPGREPIVVTVYYAEGKGSYARRQAVLADVARIVAEGL